jgi:hypothetical protein
MPIADCERDRGIDLLKLVIEKNRRDLGAEQKRATPTNRQDCDDDQTNRARAWSNERTGRTKHANRVSHPVMPPAATFD